MGWNVVRKLVFPAFLQRTRSYKKFPLVRFDVEGLEKQEPEKNEPSCPKPNSTADSVKLSIGNTVVVAEKQRIIESSPYFASVLPFHPESIVTTVRLDPPENVEMGTFLAVIFSLRNANSKLDITAANVWDFIVLAKYFQQQQLEDDCLYALLKMLPTLGMDELCRLWRKGNTYGFGKVTSLVLVGISLQMQNAGKCRKLLDFTAEELAALMSDDSFLPLQEMDVCMAIVAWCEQDPNTRTKPEVLTRILSEVVWDDGAELLLQPLISQCEKLERMPKRAAANKICEIEGYQVLGKAGYRNGIVVGDFAYAVTRPGFFERKLLRINWKTGERTEWDPPSTYCEGDDDSAQCRLCLVQFAGSTHIGCLISYDMDMVNNGYHHPELSNTIALCDTAGRAWDSPPSTLGGDGFLPWKDLPNLPHPRRDTSMIQCGTFLYVIGGMEIRPHGAGTGNADHVYRLDLRRLSKSDSDKNYKGEWERITDLNAPRTEHDVSIHYGRIIVSGGKTETAVDSKGKKVFENARWSEAYDTTLNTWTMFQTTEGDK